VLGEGRGLCGILPWDVPVTTKEEHEKFVRLDCVLAGIRTEDLPNTSVERSRYTSLLSDI
jgi:hypothetical protein